MGAVLGKCLGAVANDPKKLDMVIDKGFTMFDKDKSGFIEAGEANAAATKVLAMAGPAAAHVKPQHIDAAFAKCGGPDGKLDKAEFGAMIHKLVGAKGAPPTGAAAPAGAAGAAAPAAAATPAAAAVAAPAAQA